MLDFSIGGCRVRIHFLFLAALGVVLFTDLRQMALSGMLAALIHEGGHLLVMVLCRIPPAVVAVRPFGVLILEKSGSRRTYWKDGLVALGGPLANGITAVLLFLLQGGTRWASSPLLMANLALGVFNILPVESLDGGRALSALLSGHCSPSRTERVLITSSLLVLIPLAIVGFWLLLQSKFNFSLLAASVYLMLCLVLKK